MAIVKGDRCLDDSMYKGFVDGNIIQGGDCSSVFVGKLCKQMGQTPMFIQSNR